MKDGQLSMSEFLAQANDAKRLGNTPLRALLYPDEVGDI